MFKKKSKMWSYDLSYSPLKGSRFWYINVMILVLFCFCWMELLLELWLTALMILLSICYPNYCRCHVEFIHLQFFLVFCPNGLPYHCFLGMELLITIDLFNMIFSDGNCVAVRVLGNSMFLEVVSIWKRISQNPSHICLEDLNSHSCWPVNI